MDGDAPRPNVASLPAHVAASIPTLPEVEELTEEEVWHAQAPAGAPVGARPPSSADGSMREGPPSEHNDENLSLDGSDLGAAQRPPISIPGSADGARPEAAGAREVHYQKRRKNSLGQMSFDGSQRSVDMSECRSDVSREDDRLLAENAAST